MVARGRRGNGRARGRRTPRPRSAPGGPLGARLDRGRGWGSCGPSHRDGSAPPSPRGYRGSETGAAPSATWPSIASRPTAQGGERRMGDRASRPSGRSMRWLPPRAAPALPSTIARSAHRSCCGTPGSKRDDPWSGEGVMRGPRPHGAREGARGGSGSAHHPTSRRRAHAPARRAGGGVPHPARRVDEPRDAGDRPSDPGLQGGTRDRRHLTRADPGSEARPLAGRRRTPPLRRREASVRGATTGPPCRLRPSRLRRSAGASHPGERAGPAPPSAGPRRP